MIPRSPTELIEPADKPFQNSENIFFNTVRNAEPLKFVREVGIHRLFQTATSRETPR